MRNLIEIHQILKEAMDYGEKFDSSDSWRNKAKAAEEIEEVECWIGKGMSERVKNGR
jgi:hypothetical protein